MSEYEVTRAEHERFVRETGHDYEENHRMIVRRRAYADWLSARTGHRVKPK